MRTTRLSLGTAAVIAVTALAAGCGPSSSHPLNSPTPAGSAAPASSAPATQAAGPATNSCDVITMAQASAALGQPVALPRRGKAFVEGGVACVYYGPSAPASISPDFPIADTVRVVLVRGPDARKWFDDYRSKVSAQAISGLGDEAYYDGYASISVLKGGAYVRIAVGIADNLSAEETLARDALARM